MLVVNPVMDYYLIQGGVQILVSVDTSCYGNRAHMNQGTTQLHVHLFQPDELLKLVHWRKISVVCFTFLGIKIWDCSENSAFEETSFSLHKTVKNAIYVSWQFPELACLLHLPIML